MKAFPTFLPVLLSAIPGTVSFSAFPSPPPSTPAGSNHHRRGLPEDVVESHLKYLQDNDLRTAYRDYMSTEAKIATENDWQVVSSEWQEEPFAAILNHKTAHVLMTVTAEDDATSMCLVRISSPRKCDDDEHDNDDDDDDDDGDDDDDDDCYRADLNPIPLDYWWELSRDDRSNEWKIDGVVPDFETTELEDKIFFDEDGAWLEIDEDDFF